jgi:hypothetical protein
VLNENSPAAGRAARASDRVHPDEVRLDTTLAALRLAATRHLRRRRHVECIYRLGPRVVFELIDEIDKHHRLGDDLDQRLARYAAIDPLILGAIRGDQFAGTPTRIVGSGS